MNSDTLLNYLKCIVGPRPIDYYVLASDQFHLVNYKSNRTIIIVSNTMPSTHFGLHWCLFILKPFNGKRYVTFIDSYAMHYLDYKFSLPFKVQRRNFKVLQNDFSSYCGHYTLYFAYHFIIGIPLKRIERVFGKDTVRNDMIVSNFVNKLDLKCNLQCKCDSACSMRCEIKYNVIKHYRY